jgi:hypothetical protein
MIWNAKAVNRSSKCNPGRQIFAFELSLYLGSRRRSRGLCEYKSRSPPVNGAPQAESSGGAHESSVLTRVRSPRLLVLHQRVVASQLRPGCGRARELVGPRPDSNGRPKSSLMVRVHDTAEGAALARLTPRGVCHVTTRVDRTMEHSQTCTGVHLPTLLPGVNRRGERH